MILQWYQKLMDLVCRTYSRPNWKNSAIKSNVCVFGQLDIFSRILEHLTKQIAKLVRYELTYSNEIMAGA